VVSSSTQYISEKENASFQMQQINFQPFFLPDSIWQAQLEAFLML
jgi:hypothetical protein